MRFLNSLRWTFETSCFCFPTWNLWSNWPDPVSQNTLMLSSLQRWYWYWYWWRRGNLIRLVCMANLPGQSPTPLRIYCPGNRHRQYCYCISTWIVNIVIASPPELQYCYCISTWIAILLLHIHLKAKHRTDSCVRGYVEGAVVHSFGGQFQRYRPINFCWGSVLWEKSSWRN